MADAGARVPYMDLVIRQNGRSGIVTTIYDKRLDSKYADISVIRYPSIGSVLADKSKYGIVTSQMHRFSRRCSQKSEFVYNTALVMHRMFNKGYCCKKVWCKARAFLNQHPHLYGGKPLGLWVEKLKRKVGQLKAGAILPGPYGQIQA